MAITKEEMKQLEQASGYTTLQLISFVADGCYKEIKKHINKSDKTIILCGYGNNGQDGLAIAEKMLNDGYNVKVVIIDNKRLKNENYKIDEECFITLDTFNKEINSFDYLLDCVFGFSFHLPLSDDFKQLFRLINSTNLKVISIDLNSGSEANNEKYDPDTIKSFLTLILGKEKICHTYLKENKLADNTILIDLPI